MFSFLKKKKKSSIKFKEKKKNYLFSSREPWLESIWVLVGRYIYVYRYINSLPTINNWSSSRWYSTFVITLGITERGAAGKASSYIQSHASHPFVDRIENTALKIYISYPELIKCRISCIKSEELLDTCRDIIYIPHDLTPGAKFIYLSPKYNKALAQCVEISTNIQEKWEKEKGEINSDWNCP